MKVAILDDYADVVRTLACYPKLAGHDLTIWNDHTKDSHPLLAMGNVVCTPHMGYVERDQLEMYYSDQFDMVLAYARGNPANVINPEALAASRTSAPAGC